MAKELPPLLHPDVFEYWASCRNFSATSRAFPQHTRRQISMMAEREKWEVRVERARLAEQKDFAKKVKVRLSSLVDEKASEYGALIDRVMLLVTAKIELMERQIAALLSNEDAVLDQKIDMKELEKAFDLLAKIDQVLERRRIKNDSEAGDKAPVTRLEVVAGNIRKDPRAAASGQAS